MLSNPPRASRDAANVVLARRETSREVGPDRSIDCKRRKWHRTVQSLSQSVCLSLQQRTSPASTVEISTGVLSCKRP